MGSGKNGAAGESPPARNIIICSDGTGQSLRGRVTNVVRFVECMSLEDRDQQVVVYDPGVGTGSAPVEEFTSRHAEALESGALRLLEPGAQHRLPFEERARRCAGLLFGLGIRQNISEMYRELADLVRSPDDRVFLIGFSRGAFTVRALAGLLHRCGLPHSRDDADTLFARAWTLFRPMRADTAAVSEFRRGQRDCPVHFIGLWDTVKSYGALRPIVLPHLRHNPIATNVRHALALDEHRAWFKPTTWGRVDRDEERALTRVPPPDRRLIDEEQSILEVWFAGCHSDVGGGLRDGPPVGQVAAAPEMTDTPRIALRWMLAEAVNVRGGVELSRHGLGVLALDDPSPAKHESWRWWWGASELIPRREIHNISDQSVWPITRWHMGWDGKRRPREVLRKGVANVHETARRSGFDFPVSAIATMA